MTQPTGFTIRRIEPEEVPAAQALMIRTIEQDFGLPYDPAIHRDVADIPGWYTLPPRRALFVAIDEATGALIGTGGVRGGSLRGGPPDLVARYDDEHTAQLVRVYISPQHRRRGIGRALLRETLGFILADGGYSTITLHTFPHSPGALAFWEAHGTRIADYERAGQPLEVFFEISLDDARRIVSQASRVSAR